MTANQRGGVRLCACILFAVAATLASYGQTYTPLFNFGVTTNTDPLNPSWMGVFAQGRDGNLYSTSQAGGAFVSGHQYGTVFRLTPSGSMAVLHSFDLTNGGIPNSGLTLGTDGNLYGTTSAGALGYGTIFKITTSGVYTVLHNINGNTEGVGPNAPPIQGLDGNYYGSVGNGNNAVFGTIYKMTPAGVVTILKTFDSSNRYPNALVMGTDGNFYGTTTGTSGLGTVFKITPQGKFTVLHTFNGTDGQNPVGELIQANDGNFYGTTRSGGTGGGGVVYKITPAGVFTVLRNFANDTFGMTAFAGLVQATDGKFYGALNTNPGIGPGLLYQVTSTGVYTILHQFLTTNKDGSAPNVPLIQHTGGVLYGDTSSGGTGTNCIACGVLYSLDMTLGPFVTFLPPHMQGKVGKSIGLLGQGFTGTTKVTFNGTSATFTVVSDTYLTATVPSGAKTGSIRVTTPGGTLTSNKTFRVTPQITSFDPPSGPVGTVVTINGVSLTQTSKVTFGGVKATTLSVVSDSQITATVPAGAVTGKIVVTTAGGSAVSVTDFTVTP